MRKRGRDKDCTTSIVKMPSKMAKDLACWKETTKHSDHDLAQKKKRKKEKGFHLKHSCITRENSPHPSELEYPTDKACRIVSIPVCNLHLSMNQGSLDQTLVSYWDCTDFCLTSIWHLWWKISVRIISSQDKSVGPGCWNLTIQDA